MEALLRIDNKLDYIQELVKDLRLRNPSEKTVRALGKHPNGCSIEVGCYFHAPA